MSHLEEKFLEQIRQAGLPEPIREYKFHPTRRWRADFGWPDLMILVEIEGGIYLPKSRHLFPVTFEKDNEKYNAASMLGWTLLRFGPNAVDGVGRGPAGINQLREAIGIKMAIKKMVVEEDEKSFTGWTLKMDGMDGVPASLGEIALWNEIQKLNQQILILQERIKQYEALKTIRKVAEKNEV